jgi:hypothetical protein
MVAENLNTHIQHLFFVAIFFHLNFFIDVFFLFTKMPKYEELKKSSMIL